MARSNVRHVRCSVDRKPCFQAFRLRFGAPGLVPPCIRQRPFGQGEDRQGWPARVFAPQILFSSKNSLLARATRVSATSALRMGLNVTFRLLTPTPSCV